MIKTALTILGQRLDIEYFLYEPQYIEWSLTPEYRGPSPLFEILLRVHYNEYIEAQLREDWFRRQYERHQTQLNFDDDDPF